MTLTIRNTIVTVMIIVTMALTMIMSAPAPAKADHVGAFIRNMDSHTWRAHTVACLDHAGNSYTEVLTYGEYSKRPCYALMVANYEKIKYQSYSSGLYYTTPCGSLLTERYNASYGWWRTFTDWNNQRSVIIVNSYHDGEIQNQNCDN